LAKLTRRYFTSHGPATLQDFIWWSGLTAADARHGVEMVDRHLRQELVYLSPRVVKAPRKHSAHLLPAYDEYTVAYKDRQTILDGETSISTWDLLGPIVIVNGRAVGTWKPSVTITLNISRALKESERLAITKATARYVAFLG
jgi:Winged helix DNA-binding domain